ncbi:hypothetical protein [Agromyces sp. Soil535]|uniref:hypothetical protein n=1 Tax=Agromyces sp. Soil535 TaxID=1736390 RepID=UPI0006F377C3|nr:hypothetical protein [Agromyces sp. Soil535]KRE23031.1 hypothetical protein ASG80_09220 [Agromyces sp. Soil535]
MFGKLASRYTQEILEIRIHGVKNTPPAEMLETTPEKVQRHVGDELGSFWRRVGDRPAHGITTIEAFSWGAQARTGGGALAAIGRAFVHVGWFLLLPFALANLAYWTRWIGPQRSAGSKSWNGDAGAATVRVFGLLLTLIAVTAFCSVAIDLVAIQCFRGGTQVCAALPNVFDGLRELDRDSRAALLGLAPIATILVLYVIGRRGRVHFEERVKKFGAGLGNPDDTGLGDTPEEKGLPLLATRGFWSVARIGQTSEWLHVAASFTLVLFVLSLDAAYVDVEDCWRGTSVTITWACVQSAWGHTLPFWFGIGALALMLLIIVLVALASHTSDKTDTMWGRLAARASLTASADTDTAADPRTAWKRGAAMACLVLSIAGYTAWTILAFTPLTPQAVDGPGFLGLIATPIALIVLALFLALAGIGWRARSPWRRRVSSVLLVLGGAALLASHVDVAEWASNANAEVWWRWSLVGVAVLFVLVHLGIAWSAPGKHLYEAWRGQGAGVVMILALFSSMALSSLLVLGVASWLGTPAEAAPTEYIWRTPGEPPPAEWWNVPDAYEWFAAVLTSITALMLVLVLLALGAALMRFIRFSLPLLVWKRPEDDDEGPTETRGGLETPDPKTYAPRLTYPKPPVRRRVAVRRSSHLLHRGEPLFGWLAVFAAVGFFILSVVVGFESLPSGIASAFNAVLVAVALAAVAAVVAHAASSSERPLGVFWDVVAFFPRAGHPFAPPCYGERVVPELAARTQSWLDDPHATRPRAVIFTAHSMGSTISAATLLALRGEKIKAGPLKGTQVLDRTALLSYGTQLRAYFSRFFPSVFGVAVDVEPAQGVTPPGAIMPGPTPPGVTVLGVPGLRGPSLWRSDPWRAQVLAEFKDPLPPPAQRNDITLTALLGAYDQEVPRWRSLWRRTDFLGFPVYAYRIDRNPDGTPVGNPIDRGATESAPASYLWRIATHSDYLGTPQFLLARDDLVKAFGDDPD